MRKLGSPSFEGVGSTVRRKRSHIFRRPKLEASPVHDESSLSATPPLDDGSKVFSEENTGCDPKSRRKEFSLNQCVLSGYSEGVLAPSNSKSSSKVINSSEFLSGDNGDAVRVDNRLKKVKLKVGGITHTIQTNSNLLGASGSESSLKGSRNSDALRSRHKLKEDSELWDKNTGLRGIPWKDFTVTNISGGKEDFLMGKSKRVSKKRVQEVSFDDDEDAEIKYLERMKHAKIAVLNKDLKRSSRSERGSVDSDYNEEKELTPEGEPVNKKIKTLSKDSMDSTSEIKREPALTTRQRALLSGKDTSQGLNGIEFPNGLPPPPPRRQKEKLTEAEQQLKKAEAAQRRRLQVEKAARESEAEAIRKILGQDSSRKKREDRNKKRQEELEQEKAANALKLASNTVRWVMGPSGTVVTFPNEMGLPSIFNPPTRSYPPPREKCAGPSCDNPYKYRDSKTKLPLCSLQCYKAVQATY